MKKSFIFNALGIVMVLNLLTGVAFAAVPNDYEELNSKNSETTAVNEETAFLADDNIQTGLSIGNSGDTLAAPRALLPSDTITVTSVEMTIGGVAVDANTPIARDSLVELKYTWTIAVGDTYSFQLSPSFSAGSGFSDGIIYASGTSDPIGTLELSDLGLAVITFTDANFVAALNRTGEFHFELHFSDMVIEGPGRQDIDLGFGESQEIVLDNDASFVLMDKNGAADTVNDRIVNWVIDTNLNYSSIDNASLTDNIPAGLTVTNVTVFDLSVDAAGNRTELGQIVAAEFSSNMPANPLLITFANAIKTPYRIKIETRVDEDIYDASFVNEAILSGTKTGSGESVTLEGNSSVSFSRIKFDPLSKDGKYDPTHTLVHWAIRFNYGELSMTPEISDKLISGHNNPNTGTWGYKDDTFNIFEVDPLTSSSENKTRELLSSEYTIVLSGDKTEFSIIIGDGSASEKAYLIEYDTPVDTTIHIQEDGTLVNLAISNGFEAGDEVGYYPYNPAAGLAKSGKIDPENHEIHWTIKFNHSGYNLNLTGAVITDIIPAGQGIYGLNFAEIVVKNLSTGQIMPTSDYAITPAGDLGGFTFASNINLNWGVSIEFTTKYDLSLITIDPFPGKFINNASLDYGGKQPGKDPDVSAEVPLSEQVLTQGKKSGSYNLTNKTINWEAFINFNSQSISSVLFKDSLGPDQELVAGSIKVYELDYLANGTAKLGAEVSTGFSINTIDDKNFEVAFLGTLEKGMAVTYQSVPTGVIRLDGNYTNAANFSAIQNGVNIDSDWEALVSIPDAGKYSFKEGVQQGALIKWKAEINPNQSIIPNPELRDRLSLKQQYVRGSFKLYAASYDAAGALIKGAELTANDYTLSFLAPTETDGEGFSLIFKGAYQTISQAFILEYDQKIVKVPGGDGKVHNKIELVGAVIDDSETSEEITIDFSSGSGSGTGDWEETVYYVTVGGIVWVDLEGKGVREEHDPGIANVIIYLRDQDGNLVYDIYGNLVKPVKTNIMGRYLFDKLPALTGGRQYVAYIDRVESAVALKPYIPTIEGKGDEAHGSSDWIDRTGKPQNAGEKFMHLDFGFVLYKAPPVIPPEPPVEPPTPPIVPPVVPPTTEPPDEENARDETKFFITYDNPDINIEAINYNPTTGGGMGTGKIYILGLSFILGMIALGRKRLIEKTL